MTTSTVGTPDVELPAPDERALPNPSPLRKLASNTSFYIFLTDAVLIVFFALKSKNHVFWSWQNTTSIMGNGAEGLLLAIGLTMLIAARIFDLSLGANLILSSVVGAKVMAGMTDATTQTAPAHALIIGLVVCLLTGAAIGLLNGLLITVLKVNSLIATLGTLGIATGLALVISEGSDVAGVPLNLQTSFGLKTFLRIPYPAYLALLLLVVLFVIIRYTRYGSRTLAIGSNIAAAERAGIRVRLHLLSLTVLAGTLCGLAGYIDLARFDTTNVTGHTLDALAAATAVVVGGTALEGGRASMFGSLWGSILALVLLDGLVVLGVQTFYQQIATGAILVVAVSIDSLRSRRRE